jgi:hypothetical protein
MHHLLLPFTHLLSFNSIYYLDNGSSITAPNGLDIAAFTGVAGTNDFVGPFRGSKGTKVSSSSYGLSKSFEMLPLAEEYSELLREVAYL